ncbi:sigma-70 family RNA polymerase sigma factor [Nonomuraea sp. NPDC055795]
MADQPPQDLRQTMRDPAAFEAFYRRHTERVSRFVARRTTDPHTVDDLTTDVFLAAIDTAASYRPDRGSEEAWLYGIARNLLAAEHRRAAKELHKGGRAAGRRHLDPDDITRIEERIDAERAARPLLTALQTLPESLRAITELVDVDGLTVNDAAAALRIRAGTARVRLHRARRRLATDTTGLSEPILEGSS